VINGGKKPKQKRLTSDNQTSFEKTPDERLRWGEKKEKTTPIKGKKNCAKKEIEIIKDSGCEGDNLSLTRRDGGKEILKGGLRDPKEGGGRAKRSQYCLVYGKTSS